MRTLLHLSDLHFGALDDKVAAALVPYVNSLPHDVMVVSGDFTQRATSAQYRASIEWVKQFNDPKLFVPGNHDVPLYAVFERFFSKFGRYGDWVTKDMAPVYEDDELLVLGVATPRAFVPVKDGFWKDGKIEKDQLDHLVRHAAASPHKCCVVVTHHPFIPPPGHRPGGVVLGGKKVLPLLAASTVDVLLAGHLHASYHAEIKVETPEGTKSVLSIQAGTATSHRRRHHPDGREYPNAFNLLRLTRQRVELEVHAFTGEKWGFDARYVYERKEGRWCSAGPENPGAGTLCP